MDRKTFVFFPSFLETLETIPTIKERNNFLNAIISYGVDGVVPQLQFPYNALFAQIQTSIDKSQNRYDTAKTNGKKGGRPKKNITQEKPELKPDLKPDLKPENNQTESSYKGIREYGNKVIREYGNKGIREKGNVGVDVLMLEETKTIKQQENNFNLIDDEVTKILKNKGVL